MRKKGRLKHQEVEKEEEGKQIILSLQVRKEPSFCKIQVDK
jgi:hypothetical protein